MGPGIVAAGGKDCGGRLAVSVWVNVITEESSSKRDWGCCFLTRSCDSRRNSGSWECYPEHQQNPVAELALGSPVPSQQGLIWSLGAAVAQEAKVFATCWVYLGTVI